MNDQALVDAMTAGARKVRRAARELVDLLAGKLADLDGDMCAVCGCTQHNACAPSCAWAEWPAGLLTLVQAKTEALLDELIPSDVICSRCADALADVVHVDDAVGRIQTTRYPDTGKPNAVTCPTCFGSGDEGALGSGCFTCNGARTVPPGWVI